MICNAIKVIFPQVQQSLGSTGYPSSSDDALDQDASSLDDLFEPRTYRMSPALTQASPSGSMSKLDYMLPFNPLRHGSGGAGAANQKALQDMGVSAVGGGAHTLNSGTSQNRDMTAWNMGAYSPGSEYDSVMAAFYQQGLGYEAFQPHFVSEPNPAIFIVQSDGGYQRSRQSATANQYSLYQGPETFWVYPEDGANNQMAISTKGSNFKM